MEDVFKEFYPKLVKALPMDDVEFTSQLYSRNLLPGNLKKQVDAKPTTADKAMHFLDYGIEPGFSSDDGTLFHDLLSIMNESNNRVTMQLAKKISGKFGCIISISCSLNFSVNHITRVVLYSKDPSSS